MNLAADLAAGGNHHHDELRVLRGEQHATKVIGRSRRAEQVRVIAIHTIDITTQDLFTADALALRRQRPKTWVR
jgi:hypothetical protein